ncbi:MAG: hypothetical protein ACREP8_16800, partial [Candidatus Binatia bacterium]
ILACNADFTYLGKLPFSDSPFPPAVYGLKGESYQKVDREYPQVFHQDIQTQRQALAGGYNPTAVLQIVADYFLLGDEAQGWKEFETLYQGEDKEMVKMQLLQRLGKPVAVPASPPPTPGALSPKPPEPIGPVSPGPPAGFPQAPPEMPKLP